MAYIEEEEQQSQIGGGPAPMGGAQGGTMGGTAQATPQRLPSGMFTDTAKYLAANQGNDFASNIAGDIGEQRTNLTNQAQARTNTNVGNLSGATAWGNQAAQGVGSILPTLTGSYAPTTSHDIIDQTNQYSSYQAPDLSGLITNAQDFLGTQYDPTMNWGAQDLAPVRYGSADTGQDIQGSAGNLASMYESFSDPTKYMSGLSTLYPTATSGERNLDAVLLGMNPGELSNLGQFNQQSFFDPYNQQYEGAYQGYRESAQGVNQALNDLVGTQNPFESQSRMVDNPDFDISNVSVAPYGWSEGTGNEVDVGLLMQEAAAGYGVPVGELTQEQVTAWANMRGEPYRNYNNTETVYSNLNDNEVRRLNNYLGWNWDNVLGQASGQNNPYTQLADPRYQALQDLIGQAAGGV